ncbi:TIGR03086 family metal-binding protein [Nocardia sp. CDC159]|uniref:TIGR03086 family metal-binding protein n=1 Tax=Nocardia pulmonis TaxID=2951408 RepID=A0A9X2EFF5_9NOCA|nr:MULTISPECIES: TIGR03086 family metal-binding protein [Nocardia]MCM6778485.1 TIGR03086 family metal-binding protein [Nocardia pulmonis]MCM6791374.1 TIGR03086 family metal-binding protein [Nocardia sp. CDC159]
MTERIPETIRMDIVELHRRTADRFHTCLQQVAPDHWDLPTPCSEWDVRRLVHHVTANHERMASRLLVRPVERPDGDPAAAFTAACTAVQTGLTLPGALEQSAPSPFGGDAPIADLARILTTDLATHTWDLARAIGADETLDPRVVAELLPTVERAHPIMAASGLFAPAVQIQDSAGVQERLLAFLGRPM